MAHKKPSKKSNVARTIYQGSILDYIDFRTAYMPTEELVNRVQIINNEPMVRLDDVNALFIENEQLRETLYMKQTDRYNFMASNLYMCTQWSTYEFKKQVERIAMVSGIPARLIYSFIYTIVDSYININFENDNSNKSQLTKYLEIGAAPYLALVSIILMKVFQFFKYNAITEFNNLSRKIADVIDKKWTKPKL